MSNARKTRRRPVRVLLVGSLLMAAITSAPAWSQDALDPSADPEAVVVQGRARFTVLSDRLLRLEWSPEGRFEDRASYFAVHRHTPPPPYHVERVGHEVYLRTETVQLRYIDDGNPFGVENLRVQLNVGDQWVPWVSGSDAPDNLGGTTRTLDGVSGRTRLEAGLLSRNGWNFVDDSRRFLIDGSEWPWAAARRKNALDWYLLVHGGDYTGALAELIRVGGRIPLPPRYAFGAWWSRYWAYSDAELRSLVAEFQAHDVPLDVLVVDMDWHLDGWTGYTWNPRYFPDPDGFLRWAHEQGLKVTLNLHPADGIGRHEVAFEDACRELGLDPKTTDRIPFDCTSPEYMRLYFECLHHPLEAQGVDFWWLDWQQGRTSKLEGVDPLPWLNHLHWEDQLRNPLRSDRRPLSFSRWGGLGNHRYQVGFSGDTFCDWASLAFQPEFTATAGNVGYAYWSHDIGGHQPGPVDPELYTRWIQWGALSPILRTHTTKNPAAERRIWRFPDEFYAAMKAAWQMRYELIPYLYTAARYCYDTGVPMCRPLYYHAPQAPEAFKYRNEYALGPDLLAAPITAPRHPETGCATAKLWIPPGQWVHWYTGQRFTGPAEIRLPTPLQQVPLLAASGGIIPAAPPMRFVAQSPMDLLRLHVFPGERHTLRLYEDDGVSRGYQQLASAWTTLETQTYSNHLNLLVDAQEGRYDGMPEERAYEFLVHDVPSPRSVTLDGEPFPANGINGADGWKYDSLSLTLQVVTPYRPIRKQTAVQVEFPEMPAFMRLAHQGLRDQAAIARDWTGEQPLPPALQSLALLAQGSASDPTQAETRAAGLAADLAAAVLERAQQGPRSPVVLQRVARMLGITAEFEYTPTESSPLTLVTAVAPALADPGTLLAAVEVRTSDRQLAAVDVPIGRVAQVPVDCREFLSNSEVAVPQSRSLTATLQLRAAGRPPFELQFAQTILPSINGWWIAGPFERSEVDGLDAEFSAMARIDPTQTWLGKGGAAAGWHRVVRRLTPSMDLTGEHFVDLKTVFGAKPEDALAYAVCFIRSAREQNGRLVLGSDDGTTIWVNGVQVFTLDRGRAYSSRQDQAAVTLRPGVNVLVLRIDQYDGDWGFGVHVEDDNGMPLQEVEIQLAP